MFLLRARDFNVVGDRNYARKIMRNVFKTILSSQGVQLVSLMIKNWNWGVPSEPCSILRNQPNPMLTEMDAKLAKNKAFEAALLLLGSFFLPSTSLPRRILKLIAT